MGIRRSSCYEQAPGTPQITKLLSPPRECFHAHLEGRPRPSGPGGAAAQSRLPWAWWQAGGPGQGWGRDSTDGRRVSLKQSREGEPTWAAVRPDGGDLLP